LAERILLRLGRPDAEIGLSFVGDRRMRHLNRNYRGQNRATDVLSFSLLPEERKPGRPGRSGDRSGPRIRRGENSLPADSGASADDAAAGPPLLLGDVVISVPTALRQARAVRHSLRSEISRLMIHGLLHLLGYDHQRPAEARRMRRKERTLFNDLKLPL
jgi:probable rRNA maturation factor